MPHPARQVTGKAAATAVSAATMVVLYTLRGSGYGHQSISARYEKVLAFLAANHTIAQLADPPADTSSGRVPPWPTACRGARRHRRQK
ncbi:hypothetical protein [Frankia gtarii]|uniref:hypothetical protein n=1 Tax=Frankia gtarii TaxID=2950102 RepID=UPI0021BF7419|nr:hypothetical protein [Frankia gtarii]